MRQSQLGASTNRVKRRRSKVVAFLLFALAAVTGCLTVWAAPNQTTVPTPAPHIACPIRVLIVYALFEDRQPTAIHDDILEQQDITTVDLFEAESSTPTLAQLQQYDLVFALTDGTPFYNATALGDSLAAYVDGGGVVVEGASSFNGSGTTSRINGRWETAGYNPFNTSKSTSVSEFTSDIHDPIHPLMANVTTLGCTLLEIVTLPQGATTLVSALPGSTPLVAYRSVSGGHTTVGIAAFLGYTGDQTGQWGTLIVNAARWLRPCPRPTPTPTATPIATATAIPSATPSPTPPPSSHLANISTRMRVGAGDNVLIAGFIVEGTGNKRILIRGVGPSLATFGISSPLQDPILELNATGGDLVMANDNWPENSNAAEITASGLAPTDRNESALLLSVAPGSYTAVLRGKSDSTGTGLVEVYDLDTDGPAKIVNISTRGFVLTGDNVMIGGLIISGNEPSQLVLRGIGPSLSDFGVPDVLADPLLELHDGNGSLIVANNNWRDMQEFALQNTGLAPGNDLESAILISVTAGNYTAILKSAHDATGNGLIEVYKISSLIP
jgi:hypothetical protein